MTPKKNLLLAVAAAALLVAGHSPAQAATATNPLNVSATVSNNCTITTGTLQFGAYDALATNASANLDQTGTFSITCTKGTPYTVSLGLGAHASGTTRRMVNGADNTAFLTYEIYNDSFGGTVWNGTNTVTGTSASKATAITMTAYGRIPAGQDATQGAYSDTVVETVTF
jgi:spore coat protein U-like protein